MPICCADETQKYNVAINSMIRLKTKEEIKVLREGGLILSELLNDVLNMAEPGVSTAELEKYALLKIKKAGGRPSFKDFVMFNGVKFPSALCTSINEEIVHGPAVPGRILNNGDIISIDVGMEYPLNPKKFKNPHSKGGGYYTDTAASKIVGEADRSVRRLLAVTKESLFKGIKQTNPGNTLNDIGKAIQEFVEFNGYSVIRELVGHGVGHDLHEEPQVPHYKIPERSSENVRLKPGMVLAIEPMVAMGDYNISMKEDDLAIRTADNSLSAHFEHTIAILNKGNSIITKRGEKEEKIRRYLGVDWGSKRIGLSLADSQNKLAVSAGIVSGAKEVVKIAEEEEIDLIIIGLPFKLGDSSQMGNREELERFLNELRPLSAVPLDFFDERMSSKAADSLFGSAKDKAPRDAIAAMVILQSYLDRSLVAH
jgi:methionyl aminopeptidase